ncbi:hypothetical protein ABH931_005271 [Streptacidiphilus sp. MAP12-33]
MSTEATGWLDADPGRATLLARLRGTESRG